MKQFEVESEFCGTVSADRCKLGKAIQLRRKSLSLTQKELANRIGKSVSTVSKIESGAHPLDYETLVEIARKLETSPLKLIWDVQRLAALEQPGLDKIVPVLDGLIAGIEG